MTAPLAYPEIHGYGCECARPQCAYALRLRASAPTCAGCGDPIPPETVHSLAVLAAEPFNETPAFRCAACARAAATDTSTRTAMAPKEQ